MPDGGGFVVGVDGEPGEVGAGETGVDIGGTAVGGTDVGIGGTPVVEVEVGGDAGDPLVLYDAYCALTCCPQLVSAGPV